MAGPVRADRPARVVKLGFAGDVHFQLHLAALSVTAGVIRADDVVTRAFASVGWEWGGTGSSPDYQHFSATRS